MKRLVPYLPPAAAGIVWSLPFLHPEAAALAWLAPSLLLWAAPRESAFGKGWTAGFCFHLCALHWLLSMPLPALAAGGWLLLSAYCALYPALWTLLCRRLLLPPGSLRRSLSSLGWGGQQLWALSGAALWTSLEILQSAVLTGFPWNLLGASQSGMLPLIQVSALAGIHGVSFMIVWTSLSLSLAAVAIADRGGREPLGWSRRLLPAGLCLALAVAWGMARIAREPGGARTLRIALIQPAASQEQIWKGLHPQRRFDDLLRISRQALEHDPDLMVWPESGVPMGLEEAERQVASFVRQAGTPLVFNHLDSDPGGERHYNAAFLMDAEGTIRGTARKRRLVLFGEYVPLASHFPFLQAMSPYESSLHAGQEPGVLELESPPVAAGILICFEDAFPFLARDAALEGPGFLINLTNAAWYGNGAAQWQQARQAAFRAVETGLPLVRCANNGITCHIDRLGRILEGVVDTLPHPHGRGLRVAEVALQEGRPPTPYLRWGDLFGKGCLILSLAVLSGRWLARRKAPWTAEA